MQILANKATQDMIKVGEMTRFENFDIYDINIRMQIITNRSTQDLIGGVQAKQMCVQRVHEYQMHTTNKNHFSESILMSHTKHKNLTSFYIPTIKTPVTVVVTNARPHIGTKTKIQAD